MSDIAIHAFAEIASQVIGRLGRVVPDAEPYPWFTQDIYGESDLQWSGYVGLIGSESDTFRFGLNLEFTQPWRRVYRKLTGDLPYFSRLLSGYSTYEWHWWGRPGMRVKNPARRLLAPTVWVSEVDVTRWFSQLEDILERRMMWSENVPMRPQIKVVRQVGTMSQLEDSNLIRQNIQQVVSELEALKSFLGK